MKFGVGVIGATGYIGTPYRNEIREASEDATLVALCARRRELLEAAGREDGALLVSPDWRKVVEHPEVTLVIVATPDALHHEAVMACASQGKHVLCEKPVGVNGREAFAMWTAYREAGLAHFVPFWTRYIPVFHRAREVVRQGVLGEVQAVIYRWHNPRLPNTPFTWRDDATLSAGGSIADVGSHAYDTMRWILGMEATCVLTHADILAPAKPDLGAINLSEAIDWGKSHAASESGRLKKGTAYDFANIAFQWENHAVGSIILSHAPNLRKGLAPELELHGTEASLSVDRASGELTIVRQNGEPELLEAISDNDFGNRFSRYVFPAMRAHIAGKSSDHPDLEDGWRVQLFTDAASLSAQRGTWVSLDDLRTS